MTMEQALGYVDELSVLKRFPTNPRALVVLAEKLLEWCKGGSVMPSDQARWLVSTVCEMDEYPGPHSLHKLIQERYYPAGATAVYRSPGYQPVRIECQTCEDWWAVLDPATGKYIWCPYCSNAIEAREEIPTWMEFVNRFPGFQKVTPKAMLSAKTFAQRIR